MATMNGGNESGIGSNVRSLNITSAKTLQATDDLKLDCDIGLPGPGITRSDLLVINKIDLAPLVGANLQVMEADSLRMRAKRPFVFTNLKNGQGVDQIASFVIEKGGLAKSAA